MKEIALTKNLKALVDDEDFDALNKHNWYSLNSKYAYRETRKKGVRTSIPMHKEVLPGAYLIDHIDGNGLNNQKSNLREASFCQNSRNTSIHKDNKSGYKGVYRTRKKWAAKICVNYKKLYLGVFGTKEEAARAYNEAALKYSGEFAKLNAIPE
jgi:hypothetical protein